MPASQLKQLKASLREHGITGPQKSKKQKKQSANANARIQRDNALSNIRETFNPFDTKAATRPNKRDVTTPSTMKTAGKAAAPKVYGRPGVTKSHGEELRKKSLLLELQRRNKVGGILDRRIGEENPNMTPEEKMQQRFAREQERKSRKHALFDLEMEEAEEEEDMLTHGGRALGFDADDFEPGSIASSSDDDDDETGGLLKRKREAAEQVLAAAEDEPDRKKSKNEVMKEIIAKSKLHKYERQQAKEDDEEAREKLDQGVGDLRAALFGFQSSLEKRKTAEKAAATNGTTEKPNGGVNPERAALMDAPLDPDKDYDVQIKKLAQDTRARVTDRTRTEEEKATEASERLKAHEDSRLRRMQGEQDDEGDDDQADVDRDVGPDGEVYQAGVDDAEAFGLQGPQIMERPPGFEDEDEFVIDDDLVASGSEFDEADLDVESVGEESGDEMLEDEDGAVPVNGSSTGANQVAVSSTRVTSCPEIYEDVVRLLENDETVDANTAVRRVRLKYDASLSSTNKAKLEAFSITLVGYLSRRSNEPNVPPLATFDAVIRHLQSLSRTFPDQIGKAFRLHLEDMHKKQSMKPADCMVLTAIGTIYPTSDHFHQVVTPAMTLIARWLGLTKPVTPSDFTKGVYLTTLALKYQSFSKRYVPEVVRFISAALSAKPTDAIRKVLYANIRNMSTLWSHHVAFIEVLTPSIIPLLKSRKTDKAATKLLTHLNLLLQNSRASRTPLKLHNHRPLPLKSLIPKFEENFNPGRHYDPDRERADSARLKREFKREKKGAMRELRKDASFLAREKLREKREKDKAYEEKYRRIVASIQGEEGREAKEYEKEKRKRKGKS